MIRLIFNANHQFLAELVISGGACVSAHLSTPHLLEASLDEWQACGIPSYVEVGEYDDFSIGIERIGMKDPRFDLALRTWLLERGYLTASIPETSLPVWQLALQAPIEHTDLFDIAHLIGTSSQERLERLTETLRQSVVSYKHTHASTPLSV